MDETNLHPSPFLNLTEAAAFLRLHRRTLDNMRQRGTGPLYSKHGSRIAYHHDDLLAWSSARRRRTSAEKDPRPQPSSPAAVAGASFDTSTQSRADT